jgi:hypothetical protein
MELDLSDGIIAAISDFDKNLTFKERKNSNYF